MRIGRTYLERSVIFAVVLAAFCAWLLPAEPASAQPVPGGTLNPTTIPKYVIPLVIPPVMNNDGVADSYDIAVRQFKQQILPGGIWDTVADPGDIYANFPATTVWSYGPAADAAPDSSGLGGADGVAPAANSQFNYPAYTIETISDVPVSVRWINDLVDGDGNYLPHLLPVDQTLHWANPPMDCRMGDPRTDCSGDAPDFYTGPIPIVTHVHGAHVDPHSDGYPEAWWLPVANDIPMGYATSGGLFDDATGLNDGTLGYADYLYRQDQPATTLWYHDHALGMTRLNVYAGPAGFWLVRGGKYDKNLDTATNLPAVLPGPAPAAGDTVLELNVPGDPVRSVIREIPIVIQDRSFNEDGSLFYPDNRAFFEGLNTAQGAKQFPDAGKLKIDFVPDSDIAPIWNPEAFFNVMVVNGVSWPILEVAPARYRFRLLDGCNSRFLNLALFTDGDQELPFFQIGAEQGFLAEVVMISTGFATPLPGNGMSPLPVPAADPQQALLMAPAERADVIVDFSDLADGTVVTMTNTAPDAPFGGFPDDPADPDTTGQVMQFVVDVDLLLPSDALTTSPFDMKLKAEKPLKMADVTRQVSLNEGESEEVCVAEDKHGNLVQVGGTPEEGCEDDGEPFAPKEALLGTVDLNGGDPEGIPLKWTDTTGVSTPETVYKVDGTPVDIYVTENPTLGDTEEWEIYNFTEDAHPIHLHLVRFEVVGRQAIDGGPSIVGNAPQPWESGFKDTVIAYPGEITTVKSLFDVAGLYVWHCHIVEHEDNEMMRPYVVVEP
ncbi:MAG: multicopper oxidase family protein [Planctomycetota bacterium]|jgi:FtsP/CotA-like multicopper oxidase with cupredoxin domain